MHRSIDVLSFLRVAAPCEIVLLLPYWHMRNSTSHYDSRKDQTAYIRDIFRVKVCFHRRIRGQRIAFRLQQQFLQRNPMVQGKSRKIMVDSVGKKLTRLVR